LVVANPIFFGRAESAGAAGDMAVTGTKLVLAAGGSGVSVYDIANPAEPPILGQTDTDGLAYEIVVRGSTSGGSRREGSRWGRSALSSPADPPPCLIFQPHLLQECAPMGEVYRAKGAMPIATVADSLVWNDQAKR
jgi:hypothetical protein